MEFKALENERWIWAKTFTTDYSDEYLVSDMGRCWSCRRKKFVGSWHKGYWTICLSKNEKQETIMIGRLILTSFGIEIPEHLKDLPTNKIYCMHLDGDSTNNNLSNFAWGDNKENQNEENCKRRRSEAQKGERNHNYNKHLSEETKRKMSEAMKGKKSPLSKPILQYSLSGEFIREWSCTMDVQRQLGIVNSSISACANGKLGSAGGYLWKYKEVAF